MPTDQDVVSKNKIAIITQGGPDMTVTLITGANKGLGYETAR